jgi:hypothetical protein
MIVTRLTRPAKIIVLAVIETADGVRQQYAAISAWLPPDNRANGPVGIALVTKAAGCGGETVVADPDR